MSTSPSEARNGGRITALTQPLQRFLSTESGSAALLFAAIVVALVWANSPWSASYEALWSTELTITLGDTTVISEDLHHWVNDGLMVLFFFVVGLEISRELAMGELRDRRTAAVPILAALGGMVVPAVIYLAFNAGGPGQRGWGIPMATDIAFALGLLGALGPRCPMRLRIFLLTLAIVDDIGAIVVIAIFYTGDLNLIALAVAAGLTAVLVAMRMLQLWYAPVALVLGIALWLAMYASGVHATIAGVLMGMATMVHPPSQPAVDRARELFRSFWHEPTRHTAKHAARSVARSVSPNERIQERLHPWVSYLIVPVFAVANAGVPLTGEALRAAMTSPITWGVFLGLVGGKIIGVYATSMLTARTGLGTLPPELTSQRMLGGGAVAGIGFTVALFITELAFTDPVMTEEAKIGVLFASSVAAVLGWVLLSRVRQRETATTSPPEPAAGS